MRRADKKRGLDNFRWPENTQTWAICNDQLRMGGFSFQNAWGQAPQCNHIHGIKPRYMPQRALNHHKMGKEANVLRGFRKIRLLAGIVGVSASLSFPAFAQDIFTVSGVHVDESAETAAAAPLMKSSRVWPCQKIAAALARPTNLISTIWSAISVYRTRKHRRCVISRI